MISVITELRVEEARLLAVSTIPGEHCDGKNAHVHPEGQLIMIDSGLLVVNIEGYLGILPADKVGWVPPGMVHRAVSYGATRGRLIHLEARLCKRLPSAPTIFRTSELVKALFEKIAGWTTHDTRLSRRQCRLLCVLLDELSASEREAQFLPMPQDERLQRMAAAVALDPSNRDDLATWAARIGMSERSLTRRFRMETRMSYVQWRSMARMQRALELLNHGANVTDTAFDLGYDSVSSFITKFRLTFGITPSRCIAGAAPATPGRRSAAGAQHCCSDSSSNGWPQSENRVADSIA